VKKITDYFVKAINWFNKEFSILIAILIVCFFFFYLFASGYFLPEYISAFSAFAVALLTTIYVFTTNRQLSVMQQQLNEMKRNREIMAQPLPLITPIQIVLQKPRLYYSPPEEYSGISRYHMKCEVNNVGSSPAICIHACACIHIGQDSNEKSFHSAAEFVNLVTGKLEEGCNCERIISFMFIDDRKAELLDSLRNSDFNKLPKVQICTVYKNLIGGFFSFKQRYALTIGSGLQDSIMKNWYSQISTFEIVCKNELVELRRLRDSNPDKWNSLFERLQETFSNQFEGEDQFLKWHIIPKKFSIHPATEEEYSRIASKFSYGIAKTIYGCHHIEK
jgi:hypothetical protein